MYNDILTFWFDEIDSKMWWVSDPEFDALIKERFLSTLESAAKGELYEWRFTSKGRLAEIIVLDQFSRNVYRNTAQAFLQDPACLVLSQEAIASGALDDLSPTERSFILLPFMHSESKTIHTEAEKLYKKHAPKENYEFELKHNVIIDRFGRYPHRNKIFGRDSTPEEIDFLKQPGSSF